jgi:hypothetical protein
MMLHLKVETAGNHSCNESTVGGGGFDLGLEPADRLACLMVGFGWIAIRVFKVVREDEEAREHEAFGYAHEKNNRDGGDVETIVGNRAVNVEIEIHGPQRNGILPPLDDEIIFHLDAHVICPTMAQINNLGVEYHTQPIHTEHSKKINPLEPMPPHPLGMTQRIIIEIEYRL